MTTPLPTLLPALGSTADEVAESLFAAGITGEINDPCSCVIAAYIASKGYRSVAVGKDEHGRYFVEVSGEPEYVIGRTGPIPDFIRAFDAGAYPHLVRERVW